MDQILNLGLKTAGVLLSFLWAVAAQAQSMVDPTKPPTQLTNSSVNVNAKSGELDSETSSPQLQSVLVGQGVNGRRLAVINGQTVREGDKFNGAVLFHITETEVVLGRGKERQVLKLFPTLKITSATPP